jgi:signal transduction histidine kinase
MPTSPPLRRIPASAAPAVLLVLMAVLSGALLWQVVRAARQQEGTTRRLLAATAEVGAKVLAVTITESAHGVLSAAAFCMDRAGWQPGADSAQAAHIDACAGEVPCACEPSEVGFVRVAGPLTAAAGPSLEPGPARDVVTAWRAGMARKREEPVLLDHVRDDPATIRSGTGEVAFRSTAGDGLWMVVREDDLVEPAVRSGLATAWLPPSLLGDSVPVADVLSVRVMRGDTVVFTSAAADDALRRGGRPVLDERVDVRDSVPALPEVAVDLAGVLEGRTAIVSLRPEAAARIAADAAPAVPLPLLLAAFIVNLGLFGVAVALLRRQQALVRLRSDFVAGVSHELRTPLAQIRMFAELLEGGRLNEEQRRRSVSVIHNDARRLTLLVENVLRVARAGRGDRVAPVATAIGPLLEEAAASAAALWPRARFEARADAGLAARVDPGALRQIVMNLLENAAKYGPAGQTVTLSAARDGAVLRVWVDDEGPGVPPEERTRVWEPYHRMERDAAHPAGGTGIGLSVVRELAALHGGRAWVAAAPSGGARFGVELPDAPDGEDAGRTDAPASPALDGDVVGGVGGSGDARRERREGETTADGEERAR